MQILDSDKLRSVALELENDLDFQRAYMSQKNQNTTNGASGASVSVRRRSQIKSAAYNHMTHGRIDLLDCVRLEMYFNERYDLCPYGLRSQAEIRELVYGQPAKSVEYPSMQAYLEAQTQKTESQDSLDIIAAQPSEEIMDNNTQTLNIKVDTSKVLETVTLVYGKPFSQMSDEEVFGRIAAMEERIRAFEKIENKPKKLIAQIDGLRAEIDTLVKLVDER